MTESARIRLLIVDDSAFVRKVIREVASAAADIEIVGIAHDGLDALEQCATLKPQVLTLDLMMPQLDGLGVLRALAQLPDAPRVVVVSSTALDSQIAVEALQLGAVAIVQKPSALASDRMYELSDDLLRQVRLAASSAPGTFNIEAASDPAASDDAPALTHNTHTSLIVIGTSTGGPRALTHLLTALPADFPVPIAAVVHIPVGYTASLSERINRQSQLTVLEASEDLVITAGMAVIARAGIHLTLERCGPKMARCKLSVEPFGHIHRPAVDVLFTSAAQAFGKDVLGVVLTGMGEDGLVGSRAISGAGGIILTEHPASSVVDGMPRAVVAAGLSQARIILDRIPAALLARV